MKCIKTYTAGAIMFLLTSACTRTENSKESVSGKYAIEIKSDVFQITDTISIKTSVDNDKVNISRKTIAALIKYGKIKNAKTLYQSWTAKLGEDGKSLVPANGYPIILLIGDDETIRISGKVYSKIK
jgi:hypothetical protein